MQTLRIDPEFKALIPPLTAEEYAALEQSIVEEGCRDAIVEWDDIIIDGHNRYEICQRHNIPFKTVSYNFDSREDAKLWMIENQKARRNLNAYARGTLEEKAISILQKKGKEKSLANLKQNSTRNCEITKSEDAPKVDTTKELAKRINTGEQTASRIININKAINKAVEENTTIAGQKPEYLKSQLMNGEISINQAYQTIKRPHVALNSGNNEWYTPKEYIDAARRVMGSIDLDPASSEIANKVVQASEIYTIETDGLSHKWHGNVWLNPPYASDLIKLFVDKVSAEAENISQAIILVNNATETKWFSELVKVSSAVVFPTGRVNFYKPDGSVGAPLQGQAVFYIGNNSAKFFSEFVPFGWGVKLHELPKQ